MKKMPAAVLLAGFALAAAPAFAQTTPLPADAPAPAATPSKAQGFADKKFAKADTDHDGFLNADEMKAGMPRLSKHFDEVDADHDGKVSKDELDAYVAAHYSR